MVKQQTVKAMSASAVAAWLAAALVQPAIAETPAEPHPPVSTINGEEPDGKAWPLQDTATLLDATTSDGLRLLVLRGTRKAGTRAGIHIHKYGGHTCVLTGEITDFIEGREPKTFPAGSCYYMPANLPMSAANLGEEDAILHDTFYLPKGEPFITIIEPGYPEE